MRASLLYFEDCPNWRDAGGRFRAALDEVGQIAVPIDFIAVRNDAESVALRFAGSPTFMVDGIDLFEAGTDAAGLTCRVYVTGSGGLAGMPDVSDLATALRQKVQA